MSLTVRRKHHLNTFMNEKGYTNFYISVQFIIVKIKFIYFFILRPLLIVRFVFLLKIFPNSGGSGSRIKQKIVLPKAYLLCYCLISQIKFYIFPFLIILFRFYYFL